MIDYHGQTWLNADMNIKNTKDLRAIAKNDIARYANKIGLAATARVIANNCDISVSFILHLQSGHKPNPRCSSLDELLAGIKKAKPSLEKMMAASSVIGAA